MKNHKLYFFVMTFILLLNQTYSIAKYDFNVCRMQNCVSREKSCLQDQGICFKGFSDTRKCFQTCTSGQQINNFNACWSRCRNSIVNTNVFYQDLAKCYEEICYLNITNLQMVATLLLLVFSMILI